MKVGTKVKIKQGKSTSLNECYHGLYGVVEEKFKPGDGPQDVWVKVFYDTNNYMSLPLYLDEIEEME